jgi:hypothetical protein
VAAPGRSYEDYEELRRRLVAVERATAELSSLVFGMFQTYDDTGRPMPSTYDTELLKRRLDLGRMISQLAFEYRTEAPEVPEGKPEIPPPFDRGDR